MQHRSPARAPPGLDVYPALGFIHAGFGTGSVPGPAEIFVRNAFNTEYIPIAFPYPTSRRRGSWARWARRARSV